MRLLQKLVTGLLVAVLLWAGQAVPRARASVVLIEFIALPGESFVLLQWSTEQETNNTGFYLYRSESQNSGYARIGEFIPGVGSSDEGMEYQYWDDEVENGTTYWYKLEAIDSNNTVQNLGPISVTPGESTGDTNTETPTATATATQPVQTGTPTLTPTVTQPGQASSATATLTATQSGQTVTPTRTPTETSEATEEAETTETLTPTFPAATLPPAPGTPLPGLPPQPAETQAITATLPLPTGLLTATETLLPFPTITLVFPGEPTSEPYSDTLVVNLEDAGKMPPGSITPQRLLPLGLILLIWIILGVWLFYSLKTIHL
jgi:hypothetical protein